MADHDEVDGYRLRRSWEELQADVVARGRRLRRRRRVARALPAAAVVVLAATLVGVLALRDEQPVTVRTDPPRTSAGPAIDTLPPLAFARVYDGGAGGSALFVTEPEGSGLRRLTLDPSWGEGAPAWSPDGRWIAFDSQRDNPLRGVKTVIDVYLMRPDGSDVRRVTTTTESGLGNGSQQPSWSPDGEQLAIVTGDTAGVARIVVLRPDGSGARAITEGPGDVFPAWSPDGRWIAFQRRGFEIWLVRPDGTGAHRLATSDRATRLTWTPDARAVTFADGPDLVSVPVDGTAARTVVSAGLGHQDTDAAWTAGGALLAYSSDPDGPYYVDIEPGRTVRTGGPGPAVIVLAEPGGPVRRTLTAPRRGDSDVNATFAPR